MFISRWFRWILCLSIVLVPIGYGFSRLYFRVTGGFRIANICSDFAFDPRWSTHALTPEEQSSLPRILSQKFSYLGKGGQSYVFLSEDDRYVLKFFKYQRFRPHFFVHWFAFIPAVQEYLDRKMEEKRIKRESLFQGWITAFEELQEQTGLVYVHLNKTDGLLQNTLIVDKMGSEHTLNMDQMEFLIQKKATLLCAEIDELMATHALENAKMLLSDLVQMLVKEYQAGIVDHDPALMQNTGVYLGRPMHIDVGQFEKDPRFADPNFYLPLLHNKMVDFRNWLKESYPELLTHLDSLIQSDQPVHHAVE